MMLIMTQPFYLVVVTISKSTPKHSNHSFPYPNKWPLLRASQQCHILFWAPQDKQSELEVNAHWPQVLLERWQRRGQGFGINGMMLLELNAGSGWPVEWEDNETRKEGRRPTIDIIHWLEPEEGALDLISILGRSFWLQWRRDSFFWYKLPVTRSETASCVKKYDQVGMGS